MEGKTADTAVEVPHGEGRGGVRCGLVRGGVCFCGVGNPLADRPVELAGNSRVRLEEGLRAGQERDIALSDRQGALAVQVDFRGAFDDGRVLRVDVCADERDVRECFQQARQFFF